MRAHRLEGSKDCIVCRGKFKDYEAFLEFKSHFDEILKACDKQNPLVLVFDHCFPLENYFFGFLLKLRENDQWNIKIVTDDFRLIKSFEELHLSDKFEVLFKEVL
ncbi:hypothetical protein [Helicobacter mustelae]|uniref:Uncharacterized protein n=1 Tax=Helicobacter mustelae (strain ATCC 43772 / CCUG 25715 / CIP 103759 / LMG 18044 / NCTC 12198 / R85-136P) TaxID=679897 RepID=D3UJC1_HELM1|nr:hypothetical protein [Helicobacter mustelae]CBG40596.1 Putative hypothetical protein [Helicobacter mustelae 12198]SQH72093.1 Uncharacterised protein [Helicobacter mustelae]STP13237.1 Uncharacterised protein [Helicobacter mustelae]